MTENTNDIDYKMKLAIRVLIGGNKTSPDGFELFKAIANLALTSKAYNNMLEDLLIILSCRCIRGGGCRFAREKLYGYIRTWNITKFLACADHISQTYHQSVYIHIFTKCLLDIVLNCPYDFLASYITFLTSRAILIPCKQFYRTPVFRPGKYPGFKPRELVRALQISNENGWMDKALLLFQHLVDYYTAAGAAPQQIQNDAIVAEIKEEISKNNKLNFDGQLGNQIEQHWPLAASWGSTGVTAAYLKTLLAPKRMELSKVPKEVFDWPIEQQPWFFGHVRYPSRLLEDCSADESFIVVFQGAKLVVYERNSHSSMALNTSYWKWNRKRFYLSNGGKTPEYLHLYHFYRSLVNQDLDALKLIQETHSINWADVIQTLRQPNPFLELFANNVVPSIQIVQYLIDIGVPTLLAPWPNNRAVRDEEMPSIEVLLSAGATIGSELFVQLLQKRSFMNIQQMRKLTKAWNHSHVDLSPYRLMHFILHEYQQIYQKYNLVSERKLTVLWIYKYGKSDSCNYLQTLPKELIRVIIDFIDEPPLFYQLAEMIVKIPGIRLNSLFPIYEVLRSPYCGELMLLVKDDDTHLNATINYMSLMQYTAIRKHYHWIRQAICERDRLGLNFQRKKLIKYMMKYETDIAIFRHLHRPALMPIDNWPFTESFKTKNRAALRYFIEERNNFVMPSRDEFEAQMKRSKYKMTYEQALALVDEIKANKTS